MVGISAVCAVGMVFGWKDGNISEKPGDYGGIEALLLTHTPLHRPYIV